MCRSNNLTNVGKAFMTGTEGLGKDPGWLEKASAWASEVIPFASDIRTLAFECYKAGTGCDDVSSLNVTFAVIGLLADTILTVADIATLGIAAPLHVSVKASITAAKVGGRVVLKALAKQIAIGVAISATAEQAVNGFVRMMTVETTNGEREPRPWVVSAQSYLESLADWVENEADVRKGLTWAFGSVGDVQTWAEFYNDLGANATQQVFTDLGKASDLFAAE